MQHFNNSLDDVHNVDFTLDYPFNEPVRFPYFSTCNLVEVRIKGYDFARLGKLFLPSPDLISPPKSDYKNVRYYKCNPPAGDRSYDLLSNVMTVEAHTASFLPSIPRPKLSFDGVPEHKAYRELQQKRWVKLYSQLDDLWWALMIKPHYINGRFEEVSEHIRCFFYALLRRERIENIMRILSNEWYDSEDIDYWISQIDVLRKVKLDRERDIIESGNIVYIQGLRGVA